jgi:hypothetical protein
VAHEQQVACMHCGHSFRVCIPTDDIFPPKADTIFESDCPNCGKATNFTATAGTQRDTCDGSLPIARKIIQYLRKG